MSLIANIRDAFRAPAITTSKDAVPRLLLFGDSHVHAIQEAIRHRENAGATVAIDARRLLKHKTKTGESNAPEPERDLPTEQFRHAWYKPLKFLRNVKDEEQRAAQSDLQPATSLTIGDTTFDEFLSLARSLGPTDVLISAIGGNQHAVVSTIQHPDRFDFILPGDEGQKIDGSAHLIPFRSMHEFFVNGIRQRDGQTLAALRAATSARIVHLPAPPPKASNDFIKQYHDTQFAARGIADLGISAAPLRLKLWRLQDRVLKELCDELDIEMLPVPDSACDSEGYLAPEYYAKDATHANAAYGELVIAQLEKHFYQATAA